MKGDLYSRLKYWWDEIEKAQFSPNEENLRCRLYLLDAEIRNALKGKPRVNYFLIPSKLVLVLSVGFVGLIAISYLYVGSVVNTQVTLGNLSTDKMVTVDSTSSYPAQDMKAPAELHRISEEVTASASISTQPELVIKNREVKGSSVRKPMRKREVSQTAKPIKDTCVSSFEESRNSSSITSVEREDTSPSQVTLPNASPKGALDPVTLFVALEEELTKG